MVHSFCVNVSVKMIIKRFGSYLPETGFHGHLVNDLPTSYIYFSINSVHLTNHFEIDHQVGES